MRSAKGINKLGQKTGFVKGGRTSGKNANGSGSIGGGSKDGGVSLDSTTAKSAPAMFSGDADGSSQRPARAAARQSSMGQRGAARGRSSNNPQANRARAY